MAKDNRRSKRRRIDVMQFIDIAAVETEDEDDEDDAMNGEVENFITEDATEQHEIANRVQSTGPDAFSIPAFLDQQQAELDRDHLEDLARAFRERARVEPRPPPGPESDTGDEATPGYYLDEAGFDRPESGTSDIFSSERMQHIAGVQMIWMLPLKRMLNPSERRVLDRRIKDLAEEHRHREAVTHGVWALPATDIYTFMIPRRNDVMYIACPDLTVVRRAVRGIAPIDFQRAKGVPLEERRQLYEWARESQTFIPDLMPGHFVQIRRHEATHALADFAGDLAYVFEINADLDNPNLDVIYLYLAPRLMYKNDDVNAVRLLPASNRVERPTQIYDPSIAEIVVKQKKKKHMATVMSSDAEVSQSDTKMLRDIGLTTFSTIRHEASVSTSDSPDNHELTRDVEIQTFDLSVLETYLSVPYPAPPVPLSPPLAYKEASCGPDEDVSVSVSDAGVQASFSCSRKRRPRPTQKKRPPQRLFLPDLIKQEHPGAVGNSLEEEGVFCFEGKVYKHGMCSEDVQGYSSIARAWPTVEEAWIFVYKGLGRSLLVNLAHLRVGDLVGIHSGKTSLHLTSPIMSGIVRNISHLTVKVKVEGYSELITSDIQSVWRIFKEGDWVEDMMIRKGQLSMILNVYPDDSLDLCYWDEEGAVQRNNDYDLRHVKLQHWDEKRTIHHYRSYAWYFRTSEPPQIPMTMTMPSMIRKPLKVKAEPKDARMRRKYRNYFIGKDVYVHEGQLKGRIGRLIGIGEHKATIIFDGRPETYEIHLTSALNINTLLLLDASNVDKDLLAECVRSIASLWDIPASTSETTSTVREDPTIGMSSAPSADIGEIHWLLNPLVTNRFANYKIFARFADVHQRAGQLVWTLSASRIHITSAPGSDSGQLMYNLEMEYTSKNHGKANRERINPYDVTVANPMVSGFALVISGKHRGKIGTVKSIDRDLQTKVPIGFNIKLEGTGRCRVQYFVTDEVTRAEALPRS